MTTATATTVPAIERLGRIILAGGLAGALAGLLWGGIGGRIAMWIVFLTSDGRVAGIQSDDGFEIGVFSSSTLFLLMGTAIIGGVLGPVAAVLRSALRNGTLLTAIGFGVASGAFIGGSIVHADGIDFRLLDPLYLTVGLFLLLPAGAAATAVILLDRFLRPKSLLARLPKPIIKGVALLGAFPIVILSGAAVRNPQALLMLAAVTVAAVVVARFTISTGRAARTRIALHWAAWGVLGALTGFGIVDLVRDLSALI
jgi:hypothetical protein